MFTEYLLFIIIGLIIQHTTCRDNGKNVLLDTDLSMDVDDAFALIYSQLSQYIDIKLVQVVGPDAIIQTELIIQYYKAIQKLFNQQNQQQKIPDMFIGKNETHPNSNTNFLPVHFYKELLQKDNTDFESYITSYNLPDLETILNVYKIDMIVTIGPITNIAFLIETHNCDKSRDDKQYNPLCDQFLNLPIYLMCGQIVNEINHDLGLYQSFKDDFNLRIDPYSSQKVLKLWKGDITFIPGNITKTCWINENQYLQLLQYNKENNFDLFTKHLQIWSRFERVLFSDLKFVLYGLYPLYFTTCHLIELYQCNKYWTLIVYLLGDKLYDQKWKLSEWLLQSEIDQTNFAFLHDPMTIFAVEMDIIGTVFALEYDKTYFNPVNIYEC